MMLLTEKIYLPQRFLSMSQVAGNPIMQLDFPNRLEDIGVSGYDKRGVKGWVLHQENGEQVFATPKITSANPYDSVLLIPGAKYPPKSKIDLPVGARWLFPKPRRIDNIETLAAICSDVRSSWVNTFSFVSEERCSETILRQGFREPQLGALYAALAHWIVSSDVGNIVMPTGTGKTETMLALLAHERLVSLLVIVPTDALREQTIRKFLNLGVLPEFGILGKGVKLPVVGKIEHQIKTPDEATLFLHSCNVAVATMAVIGDSSEEVQAALAMGCSHLFIDEAHHVTARSWNAFRERVLEEQKPIIQFTATPYRRDGKHIGGKNLFAYPIKKAQEERYFTPITFISIWEYNRDLSDQAIATRAIQALKEDLDKGLDHILMARTDNIERANQVYRIYTAFAPEMNPIIVHSKQKENERKAALYELQNRQSRIVVCVDMLGEGFDLPQLKVAALHDIHKSLTVTIQFVGRFTRSASGIGESTVIANAANAEVEEALEDLYAKDSDWNIVLRRLSEGASSRQQQVSEFIDGFENQPVNIPLQNIRPKMSLVAYQTTCDEWKPDAVWELLKGKDLLVEPVINPKEKVLLFITREKAPVAWGETKTVFDVVYDLYLFYWDEELKILFINSTNNRSLHLDLAKHVAGGDVAIIKGERVYRCLDGINRLILSNLGLIHLLSKATQFTMHVGSDIKEGLSRAAISNRKKSNLFGRGYENGDSVTLGASHKGRVWAHRIAEDVSEWVQWCRLIGKKLLDDSISTDKLLEHAIIPEEIYARPALVPLTIEWPPYFYERSDEAVTIELNQVVVPFYEAQLEISTFADNGPLRFCITIGDETAEYEMLFNGKYIEYVSANERVVYLSASGRRATLSEWFLEESPIVTFEDTSQLQNNEIYRPKKEWQPYDRTKIVDWDWAGVDINGESQYKKRTTPARLERQPASIQAHAIACLLNGTIDYDVIFDDDGSGEIADIVALKTAGDELHVHLFHCKYAHSATAGVRVEDLYEVCGQAQKSVFWRSQIKRLFERLKLREERRLSTYRVTRFEKGNIQKLEELRRRSRYQTPKFHIYIIQPGLDVSKVDGPVLDLLGATELYLLETFAVPFSVIAGR